MNVTKKYPRDVQNLAEAIARAQLLLMKNNSIIKLLLDIRDTPILKNIHYLLQQMFVVSTFDYRTNSFDYLEE